MKINKLLQILSDKGIGLGLTQSGDIKVTTDTGGLDNLIREFIVKNKVELIDWLKSHKESEPPELICHGAASDGALIEASFSQESLFVTSELQGHTRAYNMPSSIEIRGQLNCSAMAKAVESLVDRHSILRTYFKKTNEGIFQVVSDNSKPKLSQMDISGFGGQIRARKLKTLADIESNHRFNLSEGPLLRISLIKLDADSYVLQINIHHILTDGWSGGILIGELWHLYSDYDQGDSHSLSPLPFQYSDYAIWKRKLLQGAELEKQQAYWLNQLKDAPLLCTFPADYPRPPMESHNGGRYSFCLSVELTEKISALAKNSAVTLFMALFSAFNILLYRYSGEVDVVVGTPISNRNHPGLEKLIGYFVNMLVIRSRFASHDTFANVLKIFKADALQAYAHQDIPFEKVVELINPKRSVSYSPLFQTTFSLHEFLPEEYETPDLELNYIDQNSYTSRFDLSLDMYMSDNQLEGIVEYSTDLFDPKSIQRMMDSFAILLESIVEEPDLPCERYPILTKVESHRLLVDWNDTSAPFPKDKCVHELFEEQVERTPGKVAVVFEEQELTYRELNNKANQLAHYLIEQGVKPETLVAICVERSLDMIVGLLGILKAGGLYVPLDPHYPRARLKYMLEDSQALFLLSETHLKGILPVYKGLCIYLDSHLDVFASKSMANPDADVSPNSLVYVIYTSGSTGQPKGVMVEHGNIVNFLYAMAIEPGISVDEVFCAVTSMSFDIHVLDVYLPLTHGACLILADKETVNDPERLKRLLERHSVTAMQATPATYKMLLTSGWHVDGFFKVLVGGEKLSQELSAQLLGLPDIEVWNMYGPTETSVWSCVEQRTLNQQPSTIGRPIANAQVYVLDEHQQLVPIGVAGELYIGGEGVVRGYLNQVELTEQQFVPNPFSDDYGLRLYKTGDFCKYLSDGTIQFLGRLDHQVKLRGFRIELGEIESAISLHPLVNDCIVIAKGETDKYLIAYVVSTIEITTSILRDHLSQLLPSYMLPAAFIQIESLPLMANGKVDRNALPDSEPSLCDRGYVAPRTEVEKQLVRIWSDVLNTNSDNLGVMDDFFEIGGHSLLATQITAHIQRVLHVEVPLRVFFDHPTINTLSKYISTAEKKIISKIKRVFRPEHIAPEV